jgi:hypothetical protein
MTATRQSWKNQPLPDARKRLPYERTFTADERARLARGLEPQEMEDKWFVFYESPWLYFHRSWTGVCIYTVRIREVDGVDGSAAGGTSQTQWVVEEAWANRDPAQYRETDDAHDVALLSYLVDGVLLGKDVAFPIRNKELSAEQASLLKHHVVGNSGVKPPDQN